MNILCLLNCQLFTEALKATIDDSIMVEFMTAAKKPEVSQYNIDGKALEAFLGPLEATVMDAIWSSKKPLLP